MLCVQVYKEVTLTTRNRWPKTAGEWEEKVGPT